jgi:diadenosine tetraphosphate (Ap4A) HIT family hydrolase
MAFILDPKLEQDTFFITDLKLCRALLMNNALYPWVILVPRVDAAKEIIDLTADERGWLMEEVCHASAALQTLYNPSKLNVAALGNQVSQLHMHVIARNTTDTAWPSPVWGKDSKPYADPKSRINELHEWLRAI